MATVCLAPGEGNRPLAIIDRHYNAPLRLHLGPTRILGVILFPIVAVIVWVFTYRYRRRVMGFVIPIVAALGVMAIVPILRYLDARSGGSLSPLPLTVLLLAEAGAILSVGLFIACAPRRQLAGHCAYCHYDLTGLQGELDPGFVCPECGTPASGYARPRSPAPQTPRHARQQDQRGHDEHQAPAKP
jgi:hypothetical protein